MLETDYPYTSGASGDDSTHCQYDQSKATDVTITDWKLNDNMLDRDMKLAVAKQPLAVAVTANNKYIHSYASGVIDSQDCTALVEDD